MACRNVLRTLIVLAVSVVPAACGGGPPSAAPFTIDTLSTGTVVVHNHDGGLWTSGEAWHTETLVSIGDEESGDAYMFEQVREVKLGPDGRIYVLDGQAKELRIYDASGQHVRTVGGEGEGPGELRNPTGMAWGPAGNLWVVDPANQRYTVWSPAGDLVETYRRSVGGYGFHWEGGFDARGELYDPSYFMDPATRESRRLFVGHRVRDDEMVAVDSSEIPSLPDAESSYYRVEHGRGYMVFGVPFMPRLAWQFDGNAGYWAGTGASYRLWHLTLAGDTSRVIELDRPRPPVTDADRDRARQRITDMLKDRGGLDQVDFSRIPGHKPAFEAIVLDDRGWIWVARTRPTVQDGEAPPPTTFDVFDPEGRYYGAVSMDLATMPPPDIVGGRVAGVVRDALGVQRVVVYRLVGRTIGDR